MPTDLDQYGQQLHSGLEYFLWKLSIPNTPSYNLNTDIKFKVRMWFHNGVGRIMSNPFVDQGAFEKNYEFKKHGRLGLDPTDNPTEPGEGLDIGEYGFDLTPFVQSVTLPPIGTSAKTDVETMLGTMRVGAFSPYSSDGGREITLQLLDTQYSILDAIFYPWLKMIGNARWYDPPHAYEKRTTNYPICTLEISTPMRRSPVPGGGSGSNEAELQSYVYTYIGARPITYDVPEINAAERSSLVRSLTMACDLVLVDLDRDSKIVGIKTPEEEDAIINGLGENEPETIPTYPSNKDPQAPADPNTDADNKDDITQQDTDLADEDKRLGDDQNAQTGAAGDQLGGTAPGTGALGTEDPPAAPGNVSGLGPGVGPTSPPPGVDSGDSGIPANPDKAPDSNPDNPPDPGTNPDNSSSNPTWTAPSDPAGFAPKFNRSSRDELDKNTIVYEAIARANSKYGSAVKKFKDCILNSRYYPGEDVHESLKDEISKYFDTADVKSVIEKCPSADNVLNIYEDVRRASLAWRYTSFHNFAYTLAGAKAVGGLINELKPNNRDNEFNYSRVRTFNDALKRIEDELPNAENNPCEAFFALKSLDFLKKCPNSSLSLHCEDPTNVWPIGLYLTPLHNELIDACGFEGEKLQVDTYPFLFRYEYFTKDPVSQKDGTDESSLKFGMLKQALKVNESESSEIDLGDARIEFASVWEIVDENLNHTGTYWCKFWVTGEDEDRIYFCKLDYRGSVIKESLVDHCGELVEPVSDDANWLLRTKRNITADGRTYRLAFNVSTLHKIYASIGSLDSEWEVRKDGECESDYNPLTAIVPSKKYSLTVELKKDPRSDALIPTEYRHLEEMPEEGDYEWDHRLDQDKSIYTMPVLDDMQVQIDETFYQLHRRSAAEADTIVEKYPAQVVPLKMGTNPAQFHVEEPDGSGWGLLMVKHHGMWSGKDDEGEPYNVLHTTNSYEDLFEQYIPTNISVIAEYIHQKKRFDAATTEQRKFLQLCNRITSRLLSFQNTLSLFKTRVKEIAEIPEVNELWELELKLTEISNAYNLLIASELEEELSLSEVSNARKRMQAKVRVTPHSELPKKLEFADNAHLATVEMGKIEHQISDIRAKRNAMVNDYNELLRQMEALLETEVENPPEYIEGNSVTVLNCIRYCADMIYEYVCISWLMKLLNDEHDETDEFYEGRKDRRKLMERLIAFFDKYIENLEEVISGGESENVSIKDLIMYCDWKAWVSDKVTQDEKDRYNETSYRLRTEELIPSIIAERARIQKKRARLQEELQNSSILVYEPSYAYHGYTKVDDYGEQDLLNLLDETPMHVNQDPMRVRCLESIINSYKGIKKRRRSDGYLKEGLKAVLDEYSELFPVKDNIKKKEKPTYDAAIRAVVPMYRELNEGFKDETDDALVNSLLLVLSNDYLKNDNPALCEDLVKCRGTIEHRKRIFDDFKEQSDREMGLIVAARDKKNKLQEAIDSLTEANKTLMRKSERGTLSKDYYADFRSNTLKKTELQNSLDEVFSVLSDMVNHYENETLKTLNAYEDSVNDARRDYDALTDKLKDSIDFENKVIDMAVLLSEIR